MIVYSIVYSDADHRKHQSFASLDFVRRSHRGPVTSPHKLAVTRKKVITWWRHHDIFLSLVMKYITTGTGHHLTGGDEYKNSYSNLMIGVHFRVQQFKYDYITTWTYYYHQIGSNNLNHCYHMLLWLCAWGVCYITVCHLLHIHSGKTGIWFHYYCAIYDEFN